MEKNKNWIRELKFHLALNVIFSVFITLSSYYHIPFGGIKGFLFYAIHFLVLQFTVFGIIYIISLFRKLFTFIFPLVFFVLISISYWVYSQDISINSGIIQIIIESNADIAMDIFSFPYIAFVFTGMLLCIFLILQFKSTRISHFKSPILFISILAIVSFFLIENYKFGTLKRKLPYNVYFSLIDYLKKPKDLLKPISEPLTTTEQNLNIVFVLGESVRADHLSLNGYNRKTTPLLEKQSNLISFSNVFTPLTYTGISVPQILTNKSIKKNASNEFYSVYSVLKASNFNTIWIGNQSLEKSYEDIVNTNNSVTIIDKFHSELSFNKKKDSVLLKHFSLHNKNTITTLHMIGSHWFYDSRYDVNFKKFTPTATSKHVGSSTKNELINSYDNTILYLDFFLNALIENIKKTNKKTVLIYISDHGETLGEEGKWFHAQDHISSKNPAMLVWASELYIRENPIFLDDLKSKKNHRITTDYLFHSILDLAKIKGFEYDKCKSIFN